MGAHKAPFAVYSVVTLYYSINNNKYLTMKNVFLEKAIYLLGAALCIAGIWIFHTYTIYLGEWYPIVGNFVSAYGGLIAVVYHYWLTYFKR